MPVPSSIKNFIFPNSKAVLEILARARKANTIDEDQAICAYAVVGISAESTRIKNGFKDFRSKEMGENQIIAEASRNLWDKLITIGLPGEIVDEITQNIYPVSQRVA